jgi:hypothetical protein
MSVFINERDRVADLMKADLICTSNGWLGIQKGIDSTNVIYSEDGVAPLRYYRGILRFCLK